MLKSWGGWKKRSKVLLWIGVVILGVFIAEYKLGNQRCENIVIEIDNESGVNFVTKNDIISSITKSGSEPILGKKLDDINLSEIENDLLQNPLIKSCQIVRDLASNLVVKIEQEVPIARWIGQSEVGEWKDARGFYINEEGGQLPLSSRYSAHVLLVTGDFFRTVKTLNTPESEGYLQLINYIRADDFWNSQINQIMVTREGEVSLMPTLGTHVIEFGKPDNIDFKLKKLRVFYNKVLSSDWNRYSKINIKFKDQVVCE